MAPEHTKQCHLQFAVDMTDAAGFDPFPVVITPCDVKDVCVSRGDYDML